MINENSKSKFQEIAEILSDSLFKKSLCSRPFKTTTLASIMAELSLEYGEEIVATTMEWYTKNCHEPWTPKIKHSHALKRLFPKIRDSFSARIECEVSEEALQIYEESGLAWPKGISKTSVLEFIEQSLQHYRNYRTKLLKYCKNDPLLDHLLWKESESHYFVKNWLGRVHKICWKHPDESPYWFSRGQFLPTLSVKGLFRKLIVSWCLEFTNDMDRINRLVEELKHATT